MLREQCGLPSVLFNARAGQTMRQRILITGSSGRVGRAIYVHLARQADVVGYDHSPSSSADHVGDLADTQALTAAMRGADAVVHVAALHAPQVGHRTDADFRRVNVDGTRNVLDVASALGVARIVLTSTTALYGRASTDTDAAVWVDEQLPPQPTTIYHRTKLAAEALLQQAAHQGGPSVRIVRMSRCFPEAANVMAAFRLHRGIDARDVASAHAAALRHAGPASDLFVVSGQVPFVAGDATALKHDVTSVLRLRAPALVQAFAQRGWTLPRSIDRVYDPARAIATLGWRPRFGFDEVLAMFDAESSEVLPPQASPTWREE
jgi:nucleoside-diphosphate-sugar epimerase